VELSRRVWDEFWQDEVTDRAAALSYYFLFALFPALLFLTALLGFLPLAGLQEELMRYVSQMLPPDAARTVEATLHEILQGKRGGLLSVGALGALWASSNGMASVMSTLNVAYDATEARAWWKRRLLAIVLTMGFSAFVMTALVLLVFGPPLAAMAAQWFGLGDVFSVVWNVLSVPVVMAVALVGIGLVYYLAPATARRWRWITPGSVLTLILWLIMSFGLRWYVTQFADYNATYGSIGGVILLMLWLYLTSVALLIGAEVNAEIEKAAAAHGATTAQPDRRQAA
jgi:membrane protein